MEQSANVGTPPCCARAKTLKAIAICALHGSPDGNEIVCYFDSSVAPHTHIRPAEYTGCDAQQSMDPLLLLTVATRELLVVPQPLM
jgi:hypothetical protein